MSTQTQTQLAIHLEVDCPYDGCTAHAENLLDILHPPDRARSPYDVCSVLRMPESVEDWADTHRTARKRAKRAIDRGYRFQTIKRHLYADDIYAINTSAPMRQGRPMSAGYHERPSDEPLPVYPCDRHGVHTYGVLLDETLVAYLWLYRSGELALVSSILGHADHLDNGIMFLLFAGMVAEEVGDGGALVYNRADSGTDGLRWFKERLGFEPRRVAWCR